MHSYLTERSSCVAIAVRSKRSVVIPFHGICLDLDWKSEDNLNEYICIY